MKKLVNNYEAVNHMELFRQRYMDPLNKEINLLRDMLDAAKGKDHKNTISEKLKRLKNKQDDYLILYGVVYDLAREHEGLVNKLCQMLVLWNKNVLYEGKQPTEMMQEQADLLQNIYDDLFKILEPLKLHLDKP